MSGLSTAWSLRPLLGGIGIAYSLGLAWLAQRHAPTRLALGVLGLNPGWAFLVSSHISVARESGMEGVAFAVVLIPLAVGLGLLATVLSLGLRTMIGPLDAWMGMGPSFRPVQIAVGAMISAIWTMSASKYLGLGTPMMALPLASLGLIGLVWTLTRKRTASGQKS